MSNLNDEDDPEEKKVDDRLSKLSLVARNVTLRLSTQATTKKGTFSTKASKKTTHNSNSQESHKNGSKDANFKIGSKIKSDTLCSTELNITKCAGANSNLVKDSSEISTCSKEAKPVTEDREITPSTTTNHGKTSSLTEQTITEKIYVESSKETQKCTPPRHTPCCKTPGQTSIPKPRIPFGTIRRKKSMKLGERTLVRRKSFLKKRNGIIAKRKLVKQMNTNDTGSEESSKVKCEDALCDKGKTPLPMPARKDISNSTFLLGECSGVKFSSRMKNKVTSPRKATVTRNKQVLKNTSSEDDKTGKSSSRSRKQWSENGVQTYEAMIFSSVFAFSEELRESSDIIYSKLQALYNSTNKTKANTIFAKKSRGLAKEWRQNNRELLNSGSQEIAGIFSNLRKVESNLKTVDQAVSILLKEKSRSKERITGSESQRIFK